MPRRQKIVLTKKWDEYINIHQGKDFIICGRGESLTELTDNIDLKGEAIIIGVNDICKYLDPDYLVCVDRLSSFYRGNGLRAKWIVNHTADTLFVMDSQFSQQDRNLDDNKICQLKLEQIRSNSFIDKNKCFSSNNSTFVACSVAINMGARNIGMIGVDMISHNKLSHQASLKRINEDYTKLNKLHKIYNLSPISKINALEHISLKDYHKLNTITNG